MEKLVKMFNYIFVKLFSLLPIQKKCIVFNSIPDYSDNAWAFYRYLIQNEYNKTYKLVWLVKDPKRYPKEDNVLFIDNNPKLFWFKRDYYLATSKYAVFTHSSPIRTWRKKQIFISTTHSASQLKATSGANEPKSRIVIPDYYVRCGEVGMKRMMEGKHLPPEKFIILGMPRLDLLFEHRDCLKQLFPEYQFQKAVIALETFKQAKRWSDSDQKTSFGLNILNSKEEIEMLDANLREKGILLIIKPHPLQDLSFVSVQSFSNIVFIFDDTLNEKQVQLYELLENCDGLLTDYSSIYYDFLFLNRPIGFMIGDMDSYKRGFIIENPLEEMPGDIISDLEGLNNYLSKLIDGIDTYADRRIALRSEVFKYYDANNSKRLLDFISSNNDAE